MSDTETTKGTPKLNAALAKAQAIMEAASKSALNPAFKDASQPSKAKGTKYADLTAVWEAIRGPLTANELSVTQEPVDCAEGWVAIRTCLLHASGEERTSLLKMPVATKTPQGYGSAITYTRRYSLAAMVGVVSDEDDDGNEASGKTPKAKEAPKSQPTVAPDLIESEKAALLKAFAAASDVATLDGLWARVKVLPTDVVAELTGQFKARKTVLSKAVAV
jgi:hypothetical protein